MYGGWALCSYTGAWTLNGSTGMQTFPIPWASGTYDMQPYWGAERGVAPSVRGWYRVSWAFAFEPPADGTLNKFSVGIQPRYTGGLFGSTSSPDGGDGVNYMHTGTHTVRVEDLQDAGVVYPTVDGYSVQHRITAAQMLVEYVGGL